MQREFKELDLVRIKSIGVQVAEDLLDTLIAHKDGCVQLIEVKKFSKGHIKCNSHFVQCLCSRVFCNSSDNIVEC